MKTIFLALFCLITYFGYAQSPGAWSEADRKYLLLNMITSRDELIRETKGLSEAQWNFHESPERWSIRQITEHLAFWELILQREISIAIGLGPNPNWMQLTMPDSTVTNFILEEKKHKSDDYTWPFTFSQPLANNTGENNLAWFLKMRNEGISYIETAKEDLRKYFIAGKSSNVHQRFITTFGHCARHVRQIKQVKLHSNYPKR